ncbi:MAG: low-specificity L-threonine aldolase [Oscillospiraceae bacterium]|nr:low-specificity L-threonine aldolase [Oscillospiraceae bacterium]MBR6609291.1 low-specificity L-threonine aldolase [Oscillospiraceae bacterium]
MNYIDLRSDSVTQPTQEMRDAMYTAPVGDDVYGDDPTVKNLEQLCARKVGKEAGLFVASGTMGNQLAVMTHTARGDEIIISSGSHIVVHEVGAAAVLAGVMLRVVECKDDILTPEIIERTVRPSDGGFMAHTSLVCMENALTNGKVMSLEQMKAVYDTSKKHNLPVHLDGARLFNASVALGVDAKELTQYCDSVMVCLSKGLCAPVGSVLCGSKEFIEKARRNRQLLGGGMRQAGFVAACGIIALEKMVDRLRDDHENAKYMAHRLNKIKGVNVLMDNVDVNMVFFKLDKPKEFIHALPGKMLEHGIKMAGEEGGLLRFITNNDVSRADVIRVCDVFETILKEDK